MGNNYIWKVNCVKIAYGNKKNTKKKKINVINLKNKLSKNVMNINLSLKE